MPTFQGADPRLFNSYGALATGLQSGVDMSAKLQEVQLRREQQARLAEQAAYEQTQRAGLEEARRLQNLTANRALDQPIWGYGTKNESTYGANVLVPQTDDAGNQILGTDGNPIMESQAAPITGEVTVEEGRDRNGNPIFKRTEMSKEAFAARQQAELDRQEKMRMDQERLDLDKEKARREKYILNPNGYIFNSATGTVERIPNFQPVPTQQERMLNRFMGMSDQVPSAVPAGTGTILVNPRAAAQSIAVNPLDQPAIDTRFTDTFNQAQPALVQPAAPILAKTAAADVAAVAKVVADAAKTGVPIGTGVQAGDPGFTRDNPIILKRKDDFNSVPGNSYFRYDGILRFKKGKTNDSSAPTDRIAIPAFTRSSWNTVPQGSPFEALNQPILDIVDAGAQQAMGLVNVAKKPLGALGNIIGTSAGYPAGAVRNLFDVNYSPDNPYRREDILRSMGI